MLSLELGKRAPEPFPSSMILIGSTITAYTLLTVSSDTFPFSLPQRERCVVVRYMSVYYSTYNSRHTEQGLWARLGRATLTDGSGARHIRNR